MHTGSQGAALGREGHSDSFEGALLGGSLTVTSRKQMTNPLGAPQPPEGRKAQKQRKRKK